MKHFAAFILVAFFASIAFAAGTRNVTLTDSGPIREYTSGGYLCGCTGFAGLGQYYASVTNTGGDVIGWIAGTTNATLLPLDLSDWVSDDGEACYGLGSEGAYLTEMTAAANSFVNCKYRIP